MPRFVAMPVSMVHFMRIKDRRGPKCEMFLNTSVFALAFHWPPISGRNRVLKSLESARPLLPRRLSA